MKFPLSSSLSFLGTAAIATTVATAAVVSAPVSANAATFTFGNINGGDTFGDGLAQYLSLDVTDLGTNGVLFQFKNGAANTSAGSFIRNIFIDTRFVTDTTTTDNPTILEQITGIPAGTLDNLVIGNTSANNTATPSSLGTVNFSASLGGNFPQKELTNPDFTSNLVLDRNNAPANTNAVQVGETLAVIFSNATYSNIIPAIFNGNLRVGYHLQGLNPGSDSYINRRPVDAPPRPVPVPGFLLGVMAAGALGGTRLLKNKKKDTQTTTV